MPTELDGDLRDDALELLNEFGQTPSSYNKIGKGAYSPTTDRAEVTYDNVTSSVGKVAPPQVVTHGMIRSETSTLRVGDAISYMAAKDATIQPVVGDRIIFLGQLTKLWEIVRVIPLVSGEQVAAWRIELKAVTEGGS